MKKWSLSDIGDLTGKTAIITGGNTGLGLKTALELTRRGAEVVIASRQVANGETAAASVKAEVPNAIISFGQLDLTDQASIDSFCADFLSKHDRLDILYHNAGLVMHPAHELAPNGREIQMQINHLGHFAMTCILMPLIVKTPGARVVQSNTVPYEKGDIDLNDFDWTKREYDQVQSYCDSRIAQLLFARHLNTLFKRSKVDAKAISMQPGLVRTEGLENSETEMTGKWLMKKIAQPLEKGCLTHLRACTDPNLDEDLFLEPKFKVFGMAVQKPFKAVAIDAEMAEQLVQRSEELTGHTLKVPA